MSGNTVPKGYYYVSYIQEIKAAYRVAADTGAWGIARLGFEGYWIGRKWERHDEFNKTGYNFAGYQGGTASV